MAHCPDHSFRTHFPSCLEYWKLMALSRVALPELPSATQSHLAQWLNNVEVKAYTGPHPFPPRKTTLKDFPAPELLTESAASLYPVVLSPLTSHVLKLRTLPKHFLHTILYLRPMILTQRKAVLWDPDDLVWGHGSSPWTSWLYELIHFLFYLSYLVVDSCPFHQKRRLITIPQIQNYQNNLVWSAEECLYNPSANIVEHMYFVPGPVLGPGYRVVHNSMSVFSEDLHVSAKKIK